MSATPDMKAYGSLLNELFESTPIGVAFFDRDLRYVAVNAAYADMNGRSRDAHTGRRVDEVLPTLAPEIGPAVRRVFETGETTVIDLTGIRHPRQGAPRHWTSVYHPVVRDGQVALVGAMVRDVTDRRQEERTHNERLQQEQLSRAKAEEQRDFFRLVLENAPMAVSICEGPEYRLVLINDFALRIVNVPREAIIDRPLHETFPEAFALVRDQYDRVYRGGEVVTIPEIEVPLPDGRKVWAYGCYAPVRQPDGSPIGIMSLSLDISAHKRTQAIVESQKRVLEAMAEGRPLSAILDMFVATISEHSPGALPSILLLDDDGVHLRHGAASPLIPERYTLAIDGAAIGRDAGSCGTTAFLAERAITTDIQTDPRWISYRDLASDAGLRACWSTPILGASGRVLGTFAIYYREPKGPAPDELKLVELMVRTCAFAIDWYRSDEQRRSLLEAERAAREEAESANRSKDEFVATLSHELRTPLNAILGWTRMLRAGQVEPESQAKALEAIERNTRAQAQLVEDLLDISRIITGKLRLDVRSVELSSVLDGAVDAVRPAAEAKGIRLQKVIDPRAAPISGDPDRLQQVVWNLISNAIKFTPKGGRVQVRLERINSHVEIIVADSGVGIPPELLPHVFDRFRQGDRSAGKTAGLGLGLAIARNLVELHGGSIDAASEGPGLGATFRVKLPLVAVQPRRLDGESHPTAGAGLMAAALPKLPPIRVLVVEDDDDGRQIVASMLSHAGAAVRAASSADEGFSIARTWKPDVLISDIEMPDEDGYAFVSRLRQQPGFSERDVPAIALTAYARVEDRIKALAAGFQMHVPKPVEPAELIAVVAAVARTGRAAGSGLQEA